LDFWPRGIAQWVFFNPPLGLSHIQTKASANTILAAIRMTLI